MRLILIRHGETAHNRDRLTLGRADVPLTERGRLQARAVASSFLRPPDAIYSSPLSRALDTAQEIALRTGIEPVVEPALIEMDVGEMEHLSYPALRQKYPEFLGIWMSGEAPDAAMPGGGETLREVQERAWSAIEAMLERHADGTVVAVSHNFVILTLLCRALDVPLAGFRRFRAERAARTVLDVRPGACTLLELNDNAHLLAAGLADDQ